MISSPAAFAAADSIRRTSEFRVVLREGRRQRGERMVLYARPSPEALRAGFVCGRHVGNAVRRNRAKRLLREAWRGLAPQVQGAMDVVFVAQPAIRGHGLREVREDMERVLRAAGALPG